MSNDFDFFQTDDDEELPDWLLGASELTEQASQPAQPVEEAPPVEEIVEEPFSDDEFDMLRERTARASEVYDGFQAQASTPRSGLLAALSPVQRFIVALLLLLNVVALVVFVMVIGGFLTLF